MTEAERYLLLACATFCRSSIASSAQKTSTPDHMGDILAMMMKGSPELQAALDAHDARTARAEDALAEIDAAIEAAFPGAVAPMDAALKSAP